MFFQCDQLPALSSLYHFGPASRYLIPLLATSLPFHDGIAASGCDPALRHITSFCGGAFFCNGVDWFPQSLIPSLAAVNFLNPSSLSSIRLFRLYQRPLVHVAVL